MPGPASRAPQIAAATPNAQPSGASSPAPIAVPHVVNDPIASLHSWPMSVRLGPHICHIPAMNAAEWLTVLMGEFDAWDILPGLCPEDESAIYDLLLSEQIPFIKFRNACLDVIGMAAGRPWWYALKLIAVASASWETVGGRLAYRNIKASEIPLGAWLDAVLLICLESIKPEQATMFLSQLEVAPKDMGIEVAEPEMSRSAFLAMG